MSAEIERPPQRRGGRVQGSEGYHKEDILALLKCVKQVVPTTTEEWDDVLEQYRQTHAIPNTRAHRDTSSLRSKFKQLARSFASGRDERPEVQEAGAVLGLIEVKMAGGKCLQRRGGRAWGAEGFLIADIQAILRSVRQVVPVFKDDWEVVAEHYCRVYAVPNERVNRDAMSLKSKFQHLQKDPTSMPRAEMEELLAIRAEIDVKIGRIGKNAASMEDTVSVENTGSVGDLDARSDETKIIVKETVNGHKKCSTSSEGAAKSVGIEPPRRGRPLGSEGYTRCDTKALLACVKEVLPAGPTSWEQVLQLYRMNHTTPNNRAPRNMTGVKSKFRQLVNWKQDMDQVVPQQVLEARSIQRDIDVSAKLGKRPRSESGSNASFSHTPEASTPDAREEQHFLSSRTEPRNNDNIERQNVFGDRAEWSVSPQVHEAELVAKRHRQDTKSMKVPAGPSNDALRSEIASRELELLRQREQREAEQAMWEKERALREKQRMDMEAWTFVCDRLRTLYREQATENDPEIASEIDEEIAVLKKKKQRLAGLM
ncbi:hypothetical protein KRP22_000672 [Phytophthora ramorum]|uniref:uncharacterized protein n=1 Tax=Phytophthora ramorum TaxID=164328 RepID=UPI003096B745|nr:hypothetical protein KRP23_7424 [Phytophthora ramorum]KAH7509086.1 hypothetical protein KRP22_592 [Phytophthora ramorum]